MKKATPTRTRRRLGRAAAAVTAVSALTAGWGVQQATAAIPGIESRLSGCNGRQDAWINLEVINNRAAAIDASVAITRADGSNLRTLNASIDPGDSSTWVLDSSVEDTTLTVRVDGLTGTDSLRVDCVPNAGPGPTTAPRAGSPTTTVKGQTPKPIPRADVAKPTPGRPRFTG